MSFACPVPRCGRPARDWQVCRTCADALAKDLAAVATLVPDVETTLARGAAAAGPGGRRSATPPLPFDPAASAVLGALKATLVGWVRVLAEDSDGPWPADTSAACAAWLLERIAVLRTHPAAVDIVVEIGAAVVACGRVIDRAPERLLAGPCDECGAPMYAKAGAASVWCSTVGCTVTYDVAERRAVLLDCARDQLLSMPEMCRALPGLLGHELNDNILRVWRCRGRLVPRGHTATGKATFRVGDVLDLLKVSTYERRPWTPLPPPPPRPPLVRVCRLCGETDLAVMVTNRQSPDGLKDLCARCNRERVHRHRQQNGERAEAEIEAARAKAHPDGTKRCTYCLAHLPFADFHVNRAYTDGLQSRCRACSSTGQRLAAAVRAAWEAAGIDPTVCAYCSAPADTMDHVRPTRRGGGDQHENLVPACRSCNTSKGRRDVQAWYLERFGGTWSGPATPTA